MITAWLFVIGNHLKFNLFHSLDFKLSPWNGQTNRLIIYHSIESNANNMVKINGFISVSYNNDLSPPFSSELPNFFQWIQIFFNWRPQVLRPTILEYSTAFSSMSGWSQWNKSSFSLFLKSYRLKLQHKLRYISTR